MHHHILQGILHINTAFEPRDMLPSFVLTKTCTLKAVDETVIQNKDVEIITTEDRSWGNTYFDRGLILAVLT